MWLVASPRAAFASAGLCEPRSATVELPSPLACVEIAVIAGIADADVAGFCDLRGATGIAPRPALVGSDGFLDVGPGCNPEIRGGAQLDRDAPSPVVVDASSIDRVTPSTDLLVVPPAHVGNVSFPDSDAYALPRGFRRVVDHPPRTRALIRVRGGARRRPSSSTIARFAPCAHSAGAENHAAAVDTRGPPKKARPGFSRRSARRALARGTSRSMVVRFSNKERK